MITVLAGGVGAARLLRGLIRAIDPSQITVVINTGDDFTLHGLRICPDIDTVRYTLSEDIGDMGWGRANESWRAMEELGAMAGHAPAGSRASAWFSLGDRDLGVHLYRTQRLAEGASLSRVTAELTSSVGLHLTLLPMSDEPVATRVTLGDGEEVDFQEYFVRRRHSVPVADIRFAGIARAKPAPGVLDAIEHAERVIIAPSNPLVSIGPVLAVPGVATTLANRRDSVIAVSPIVNGKAIKGPADHMLTELGHEASVVGVARLWSPFASRLVVDIADKSLAGAAEAQGMTCVATETVMSDIDSATALAGDLLHLPLA